MSEDQSGNRSMGDDGTQEDAQAVPGGYGPPVSVGGVQEPGGPVPPYDGRQTSASVDEGGTHRDGANVGGATGPRTNTEGYSSPSPSDTPGGRVTSPSDEMPATDDDGQDSGRPSGQDPDTGPAHYPGTGRGEDKA
ncbi:MAG: hypothetical protein ABJA34_04960 [Pseudonocardiales bacterium]